MGNKKIFILLPDGIGLRNFAFSNFYKLGKNYGNEIVFWNNTMFSLSELNFPEIKIENAKTHPLTDIYKRAKIEIELNLNKKRANDSIYDSYKFSASKKGIKNGIKYIILRIIIAMNNSNNGLERIRKKIGVLERKTKLYHDSLETLKNEKPDFVFCTNQRVMLGIAPLLAANDLGIPTGTFIFSWDNLPKATKIIDADFYFVWSLYMKNELLYYYPNIKEIQIKISGTPQFEMHFDNEKLEEKTIFFNKHSLDINKKYICFTGDDTVTSPDDPCYLSDLAIAIQQLNLKGFNLGILFRRCPVDFSNRYDYVLDKFKDEITSINPAWTPLTESWNTILPQKEDDSLLSSIAEYSEMVVNLGSSTIFDFIAHKKPCGYFRYNQKEQLNEKWNIHTCYKFVHFRSMPNNAPVFWMDSPIEIEETIKRVLNSDSNEVMSNAQKWFEKINYHPPQLASERIWRAIDEIINSN
ncbi:UDP-glycosyltransferase [Flavobacterium capsici]|uniref:UDP-glycosyltransferase n=1 Tax=Flavobacterium capsici TaxID=3075618 RepID=A0AA96F0P6_9FLAO|nr:MULTISPECIES: UDP-glycosyltransferase [unclassified Flavobacterium]WNM20262.1 UDP-glycosyltransferase [Flavobacterium sp. PMR2A8]WNM21652.1 UDP-glycosyltransferase [Flavobacterium sp. PMTSA4]